MKIVTLSSDFVMFLQIIFTGKAQRLGPFSKAALKSPTPHWLKRQAQSSTSQTDRQSANGAAVIPLCGPNEFTPQHTTASHLHV